MVAPTNTKGPLSQGSREPFVEPTRVNLMDTNESTTYSIPDAPLTERERALVEAMQKKIDEAKAARDTTNSINRTMAAIATRSLFTEGVR